MNCRRLCGNQISTQESAANYATPARWRGDAGSSPLDQHGNPTHWLISTQADGRFREPGQRPTGRLLGLLHLLANNIKCEVQSGEPLERCRGVPHGSVTGAVSSAAHSIYTYRGVRWAPVIGRCFLIIEWLIEARHRFSAPEYLVLLFTFASIHVIGLEAGFAAGLAFSALAFACQYARVHDETGGVACRRSKKARSVRRRSFEERRSVARPPRIDSSVGCGRLRLLRGRGATPRKVET